MTRVEKWALSLLLYTVAVSIFRHSLWLGLSQFAIIVGLFENIVAIIFFIPAFVFHKTNVTPEKSWYWSIPLGVWLGYSIVCFLLKIFLLTFLLM